MREKVVCLFLVLGVLAWIRPAFGESESEKLPETKRSDYADKNVNNENRVFIVFAQCDGHHAEHDVFMATALNHFIQVKHPKFLIASVCPWGNHNYRSRHCRQPVGYLVVVHNPGAEPKPQPKSGDGKNKSAGTETSNRLEPSSAIVAQR